MDLFFIPGNILLASALFHFSITLSARVVFSFQVFTSVHLWHLLAGDFSSALHRQIHHKDSESAEHALSTGRRWYVT